MKRIVAASGKRRAVARIDSQRAFGRHAPGHARYTESGAVDEPIHGDVVEGSEFVNSAGADLLFDSFFQSVQKPRVSDFRRRHRAREARLHRLERELGAELVVLLVFLNGVVPAHAVRNQHRGD